MANLQKKMGIANDLQSVVRTMKAISASSIAEYEKSLNALTEYFQSVELALGACFRKDLQSQKNLFIIDDREKEKNIVNIVVFGSDQGLVGKFNDVIAQFALKEMEVIPNPIRIYCVGERVQSRLIDMDQTIEQVFLLPTSVKAITPLIGQILLETISNTENMEESTLYLIYNERKAGALYESVIKTILPLNQAWQQKITRSPWPSNQLAEIIGDGRSTLVVLLREYLFVSLFRACTESLASENVSRLAAMQRADQNIVEVLESMNATFHQLRQAGIDEELFDVISGFEAISKDLT